MVKFAKVHQRANSNKIIKNVYIISYLLKFSYSKTSMGNIYGPHIVELNLQAIGQFDPNNDYDRKKNYDLEFPFIVRKFILFKGFLF